MDKAVTLFNGKKARICCDDCEVISVLYDLMIEPFIEDLECSWLLNTASETKAKGYLSYVGSLMIRDPISYNVKSDRSLERVAQREILVDDVDNVTSINPVQNTKTKKKHEKTRFEKINPLITRHGSKLVRCKVDTKSDFVLNGIKYHVSDNRYCGVESRGMKIYYPMDIIYCVDEEIKEFYTQEIDPIDQRCVTRYHE